jgi:hypothetical protein
VQLSNLLASFTRRVPAVSLAGVSLLSCLLASGCGGSDGPGPTASLKPVIACASLAGQVFDNVQVATAANVPASGAVPAYCKVNGTQTGTQHDMELRLPEDWQRRYVQEGGGGFDGSIRPVGAQSIPLSLHAVDAANNGGHRDPSGSDFLNDAAKVQLYAHTAIGVTAKFGKAVTQKYYGQPPSYSYYQGCSNGGRGALNAADKYGAEFNAVISGAPTRNLTGQIEQWTRATQLTLPSTAKLAAISAAAIAKCDALDGVSDGIVSKWSACQFDPAVDVPASVGVTASEAAAVKALMTDLKLSDGTTIYSGFGTGSMTQWGPAYAGLGVGHMKNIVLNNPNWDPATFSVDGYFNTISNVIDGTYGFSASTNGLANFLKAGKKVVVWHGSDDSLLSHKDTIRTWQPVAQQAGDAASNSRLYIAAGVSHCGGGPGADTFDLLTPTMAWVEQGTDPGSPTASKLSSTGAVQFTRPLCPHPSYPKYKGSGDVNSASSYECSTS